MILPGSRYADSTVAAVDKGGTNVAVIVPGAQNAYSFSYVGHTVTIGERIDGIAFQYYNDATLWWRIADANPEMLWWDGLEPGTILRIPAI